MHHASADLHCDGLAPSAWACNSSEACAATSNTEFMNGGDDVLWQLLLSEANGSAWRTRSAERWVSGSERGRLSRPAPGRRSADSGSNPSSKVAHR
eukprot:CAMPEP_0195019248 /NCGR_PEP_ID=MMETSP0326_2-20130528/32344_1 /TAXON_ID=2866 ORGANISM="Crypthecodinium cohnii, Strain Seligo" /NCGR_SAMPLE_ID=MMETSP0326_2 /ASSEMBLY_ACC=CAM_ASM_000348 /LENGTH=95 /DNA_ID=CAMNT_0040037197 /DNA_START=144 /DNA_END=432 /DNA_ORIENTATION=-